MKNIKSLYIFFGCIIIPYLLLMGVFIFNTESLSDSDRIIGISWFTLLTAISCMWIIRISGKIDGRLQAS